MISNPRRKRDGRHPRDPANGVVAAGTCHQAEGLADCQVAPGWQGRADPFAVNPSITPDNGFRPPQ